MRLRFLLPLLFAATLQGQTWFTVVPASQQGLNVTVTMPPGTQYQIVAQPCPDPVAVPVATAKATPVVDYADGVNGRPADSCPGFPKAFQVLETAAVQQIQVTASGKVTTVGVPALAVVTPPPPVDTVSFNMTLNYKGQTVNASCSATPVVK